MVNDIFVDVVIVFVVMVVVFFVDVVVVVSRKKKKVERTHLNEEITSPSVFNVLEKIESKIPDFFKS